MTPHFLFEIFTAGEAAEILEDGIGTALYEKLWSLHPEIAAIPRENFNAVALINWWERFTEEECHVLNRAIGLFEDRCRKLAS